MSVDLALQHDSLADNSPSQRTAADADAPPEQATCGRYHVAVPCRRHDAVSLAAVAPEDTNNLLISCPSSLEQGARDAIATEALLFYYQHDSVHFGLKCPGNPHQLIPDEIRGAVAVTGTWQSSLKSSTTAQTARCSCTAAGPHVPGLRRVPPALLSGTAVVSRRWSPTIRHHAASCVLPG